MRTSFVVLRRPWNESFEGTDWPTRVRACGNAIQNANASNHEFDVPSNGIPNLDPSKSNMKSRSSPKRHVQ